MMNISQIEWCNFTWNPVTGCWHGCPYCYAAKQAKRFSGEEVFRACEAAPWHNYFFMTRYPQRYEQTSSIGLLPPLQEFLVRDDRHQER